MLSPILSRLIITSCLSLVLTACGGSGSSDASNTTDTVTGAGSSNTTVVTAASLLTSATAIDASEQCPAGGYRFDVGIDSNNNKILDQAEIQNTSEICHGTDGKNGIDGKDGKNGKTVLTTMVEIQSSETCPTGGYLVRSGLDLNDNKILDLNE